MKIIIETKPYSKLRYKTCGDWFFKRGVLHIQVAELGNWKYEFLVFTHELIEVFLCKAKGISQASVDKFDFNYEKNRKPGDESEPGDYPTCPYRIPHLIATGVEKILAAALLVNWLKYENRINEVCK